MEVLFNNYDAYEYYQNLALDSIDEDEKKMDDAYVQEYADNLEADDWEFTMNNLSGAIDKYPDWKIEGYIERWDGKREVNCKLSDFEDFNDFVYTATSDCDYRKWEGDLDNDIYTLTCSHHDGTNVLTLTPIKGEKNEG